MKTFMENIDNDINTHAETYDSDNVFAKIINKQIPCKMIYEDDVALCFYDIAPKSKIHALVIPKGPYSNMHHFHENATKEEIYGFYAAIHQVINLLEIAKDGYRLISNTGKYGFQEVPHYHVHILAGEPLRPSL